MPVTVICVGKLRERFFADAAAEYLKRLRRLMPVTVIEVPDEPEPAKRNNDHQCYNDFRRQLKRKKCNAEVQNRYRQDRRFYEVAEFKEAHDAARISKVGGNMVDFIIHRRSPLWFLKGVPGTAAAFAQVQQGTLFVRRQPPPSHG